MLVLIGTMGGYFLVPMNSLLQRRGHLLMGSGHFIAVILGLFLSATTALLRTLHGHDQDHGES